VNDLSLDRATFGPLGFGSAVLGNLYAPISDTAARATVREAVDLGFQYFDTAPHYGFGLSEKRLGAALHELDPRQELIVSTKAGRKLVPRSGVQQGQPRQGFVSAEPCESEFDYTYDSVMRTYEDSLRRLQRERIDILYGHDLGRFTHGDNHPKRFKEFMDGGYRAMSELRAAGAVGAIGIGVNEWEVCVEALGFADFDVVMLAGRYTLLEQLPLEVFLPLCAERGVRVIVGGPYNSGILATGTGPATGMGKAAVAHYNYSAAGPEIIARVAAIEAICAAHNVPLPAAALQFPLAHPQVLCVVAGFGSSEEVTRADDYLRLPIPPSLWSDLRTAGLLRTDAPVPIMF
jgi:D-threo-aldose 1-dehydrogenase